MGRYTPTVVLETEFDGDVVRVEMKRMTSAQSMRLAPFLRQSLDGKGIEPLTIQDKVGLFKESMTILPECIVSITGVRDANGLAIDQQTILSQEYFGPLAGKIMEKLMESSRLKEDDAKKLDEPPVEPPSVDTLKAIGS